MCLPKEVQDAVFRCFRGSLFYFHLQANKFLYHFSLSLSILFYLRMCAHS